MEFGFWNFNFHASIFLYYFLTEFSQSLLILPMQKELHKLSETIGIEEE